MSTAIISPLSSQERDDLVRHTATIKRTKDAYIECGLALAAIRDGRLYRETHDTLARWAEDEVGLTPQRIAQIIAAAKACQTMFDRSATTLPANSRQAAALAKVPEEHRVEIFEAAQEATGKEQPPAAAIDAQEAIRLAGGVAPATVSETESVEKPSVDDGDSWCSPELLVAAARTVMGRIDCDPASNALAQNVVHASKYYTKENNGLEKVWHGKVYFNFPYSLALMRQFTDALLLKWKIREIHEAVGISNASTCAGWWQDTAKACTLLAKPSRRIGFWHPEYIGTQWEHDENNRYDQTIWYFGDHAERFLGVCKTMGWLPMKPESVASVKAIEVAL